MPLKDSGNRREFETGAVRDMQEGKGRCDLLPPYALLRLAKHFEVGARKYDDRNWEKGIPINSFIDSAIRHILFFMAGESDEDHLCAAAWNLICAMETEAMHGFKFDKRRSDENGCSQLKKAVDNYDKTSDLNDLNGVVAAARSAVKNEEGEG